MLHPKKFLSIAILASLLVSSPLQAGDNELTAEERNEGYILLFNGKDLKGWERTSPGFGGWHVEDGALCLAENGAMLFTSAAYDNFVLKIDFKMSSFCNSGVFFRVGNPRDEVQTGIEVQVLDDRGKQPSRNSCGSIYDLVAPTNPTVKPAGEWNSFVITANKNMLSVELNSAKVAEMDLDEWDKPGQRPDGSRHKFKDALKDFPRKGLIGLQDHGRPVCYKNIKIKPLK